MYTRLTVRETGRPQNTFTGNYQHRMAEPFHREPVTIIFFAVQFRLGFGVLKKNNGSGSGSVPGKVPMFVYMLVARGPHG